MARRQKGRRIDGVFLLDKPAGISSNHALQRVKRLFDAAKAGHTGALDPLATGLLPICLGEATKFSHYLLDSDKAYVAEAKLGVRTDSSDADGEVVETKPVPADLSEAQIVALFEQNFNGEIEQVPSMYSALKHQGQPLYKLARKGVQVEVKPRKVTIHRIKLLSLVADTLTFEVACSKGTYVRSIVEDLGLMLGCGAHITALRRIAAGPYDASMMLTLPQLEAIVETARQNADQGCIQNPADTLLLPAWSALEGYTKLVLTDQEADRFLQGQRIKRSVVDGEQLVFAEDERFLGVGEGRYGVLHGVRLINTQ